MAQQVRPAPPRPERIAPPATPPAASRSILVLRGDQTGPQDTGLPRARAPRIAVPRRLLTNGEKLDLLRLAATTARLPVPTGVINKAVLTPTQPFLRNQASIIASQFYVGLHPDGRPQEPGGPSWLLNNDKSILGLEFLPFRAGQLTIVVFHIQAISSGSFVVNGHNLDPVDNKVVFAVTPASTAPVWIYLRQADAEMMTDITAVEIFVAP